MQQQDKAARFRALHARGEFLMLPNAWDAGSARYLASLGASAVATSSASLAWAHGYPDGEHLPRDLLVQTVTEIVRVVDLPITVDSERGFGATPVEVGEAVARLIGAGAVGINIEDGGAPPAELAARIEAIRRVALREGVALFINARTDLWLRPIVPPDQRVAEAALRGRLYQEAGGDGFFVPRLSQAEEIAALATAVSLPLNLMAVPDLPPVATLRQSSVNRISLGVMSFLRAYGGLRQPIQSFLRDGQLGPMFDEAATFPEINALFG